MRPSIPEGNILKQKVRINFHIFHKSFHKIRSNGPKIPEGHHVPALAKFLTEITSSDWEDSHGNSRSLSLDGNVGIALCFKGSLAMYTDTHKI